MKLLIWFTSDCLSGNKLYFVYVYMYVFAIVILIYLFHSMNTSILWFINIM